MTHADHIAKDGLKLELDQLCMLPLVLFHMICGFFSNEQTLIRQHRGKHSVPTDWESHIPGLLEAEWAIAAIKAEGARRLLAGEAIDFNSIPIPPPPGDWQPLVKDAADLLRRFEIVASFHADPETFIRRNAERLVRRGPLRLPGLLPATPASTSPAFAVEASATLLVLIHRSPCLPLLRMGRWLRAQHADGGGWLNVHPP